MSNIKDVDIEAEYESIKGLARAQEGVTSKRTFKLAVHKALKQIESTRKILIGLSIISVPMIFAGVGIALLPFFLWQIKKLKQKKAMCEQFLIMADQDPTLD